MTAGDSVHEILRSALEDEKGKIKLQEGKRMSFTPWVRTLQDFDKKIAERSGSICGS